MDILVEWSRQNGNNLVSLTNIERLVSKPMPGRLSGSSTSLYIIWNQAMGNGLSALGEVNIKALKALQWKYRKMLDFSSGLFCILNKLLVGSHHFFLKWAPEAQNWINFKWSNWADITSAPFVKHVFNFKLAFVNWHHLVMGNRLQVREAIHIEMDSIYGLGFDPTHLHRLYNYYYYIIIKIIV